MFDFLSLKRDVSVVAAEIKSVRDQNEKAKQRRDDLHTLPPQKIEVLAELQAMVDRLGSRSLEHVQRSINQVITGPLDRVSERQHFALLGKPGAQPDTVNQGLLFLLLGDLIKDAIPALLDRVAWPEETGPLRDERLAEIKKLDAKIIKLENQEAELLSAAEQAGIKIEPFGKHSAIKG